MRLPITALLLTGGKSSRMGRDKTRLPYEGGTLLSFMSKRLEGLCEETVLCGTDAEHTGLRVVPDHHPGTGPLAGLEAGLRAATQDWAFAIACDMPHFSAEILKALWERAQNGNLDAVIPEGPSGPEPLHALYHKRALVLIEEAFSKKQYGLEMAFRSERVARVPWDSLCAFDSKGTCFQNWNRPEDLAAGVRISLAETPS